MAAHLPAKRHIGLAAAILFCCSQAAASEDVQVHCRGRGPSLYLIGGGPAFTTWNLQPIQDRLSDGYRVCRWDMRGVGGNAGLPLKPGVSALAQWLDDMGYVLPPAPLGKRQALRPGWMRPLPVGGESASLLRRPGASAPGPVGFGGAHGVPWIQRARPLSPPASR